MAYATVDDVQARVPHPVFGTSTKPTRAQVTDWVTEAEADVNGALVAVGNTSPVTSASGILILRNKVAGYVAGLARQALAAASGDGDNEDGDKHVEAWIAFIEDIEKRKSYWEGVLTGSSSEEESTRVASHVTDNNAELSISNGDFDPEFKRGDVL